MGGRCWYVKDTESLCQPCVIDENSCMTSAWKRFCLQTLCWSSGSIFITVKVYSAGSVAQTLATVMAGMRC